MGFKPTQKTANPSQEREGAIKVVFQHSLFPPALNRSVYPKLWQTNEALCFFILNTETEEIIMHYKYSTTLAEDDDENALMSFAAFQNLACHIDTQTHSYIQQTSQLTCVGFLTF